MIKVEQFSYFFTLNINISTKQKTMKFKQEPYDKKPLKFNENQKSFIQPNLYN